VVLAHVGAHLNNSHAALPGDTLPLLVSAVVYGALGLAVSRGLVPRIARHHARARSVKALGVFAVLDGHHAHLPVWATLDAHHARFVHALFLDEGPR
jgi:hypothetical protein